MLEQFRAQKLEWNRANNQIYDRVETSSGDSNGRTLFVQISNGGTVEDLTGATLSLAWSKRTEQGLETFEEVDAKKGQYRLFYPTGMLVNHGVLQASLVLVDVTGRIESKPFDIIVHKGTVDDEAVESDNKFTALTTALVKVSQVQAEFDGLYADKSQMMDTLHDDKKADMEALEADYSNRANTLEATYAPRLTEVSAQLAQTEHYMNQLQNLFMGKGLEPYWIETAVEFGFTLGGVPAGISNYEGGNYYLEVSGSEGDNFVTVTGGNIAHAGQTTSWASVIKDDSGNWKPYRVLGTDGIDQVEIIPPLQTTITNGELANVHDAKVGQHYTERGYFALAQHIYNYSPFYANRNKVISKFNPRTDSIEENKWNHVDIDRTPVFSTQGIRVTSSGLLLGESKEVLLIQSNAGKKMESNYEVDVSGKKGYVETHIRSSIPNLKVDFYLDDVLVQSYDTESSVVNKLKFRFDNAEQAKLSIYAPNTTAFSSFEIGRTTWYETDETALTIIPPHSRLVYLGDSWGEYHNRAVSRELSRLLTRDSGTTVEVFNDSKGGMTSKWGMAWFEEYVIKNRPTHVIIEFFTNDLNSIYNSLPYNYLAPDGQTYSGKIAYREEWLNNIKQMANISKRYGIQPIIVAPAVVEGDSQILRHLTASNLMFD